MTLPYTDPCGALPEALLLGRCSSCGKFDIDPDDPSLFGWCVWCNGAKGSNRVTYSYRYEWSKDRCGTLNHHTSIHYDRYAPPRGILHSDIRHRGRSAARADILFHGSSKSPNHV